MMSVLQQHVKHITDDNCRVSISYSINASRAIHVTIRFSARQKVLRILLVIHAHDGLYVEISTKLVSYVALKLLL
jgi:hypothetical protein